MTVWAGYFLRGTGSDASTKLTKELSTALSRREGDVPWIVRFERASFAYVESGAFEGASTCITDEGFSLVAGEPFLKDGSGDRADDIRVLHAAWTSGDFDITGQAGGTFAATHYDGRTHELTLISDRFGVRPIYFAIDDQRIVFASALRILEALSFVKKVIDLRGAIETIALGYPLADRTPYRNIYTIRDAEVVSFRDGGVNRRHYWRINRVPQTRETLDRVALRAHDAFSRAIDKRLRGDRRGVAFLSGGLDSRCIAAELVTRGVALHTFNFADDGSQDEVLGDAFAQIAGTLHSRTPRPADPIRWSLEMSRRWEASPLRLSHPVERPLRVWSGDGGSVGFGFVGVYPSVIQLLRQGRRDDAVERYFTEHEISLPTRIFKRGIAVRVRDFLREGVREAFDEVRVDDDPGRELYMFRMLHDQRRHLALHFEDADLHRLELHLPFYDAQFLEVIASAPTDYCVGHRLYHASLTYFPPIMRTVPWQTYPGHEPCPIPMQQKGIDQWGREQRDLARQKRRRTIVGEAMRSLKSPFFPGRLFRRGYILASSIKHWLGRGDYSYVMEYAATLETLWRLSDGRWSLDSDG
jgi:hypothetical protein